MNKKNHTKGFPHVLVEVDGICVLHELSDHLSLVILHHQHFLRLCHPTYHQQTHLPQEINSCQHRHTSQSSLISLTLVHMHISMHVTVCALMLLKKKHTIFSTAKHIDQTL